MKTFNFAQAFQVALIAAAIGGASTAALADIKDYRFELVDQTVQAGPDKVISIRLMNTAASPYFANQRSAISKSRCEMSR